MPNSSILSAAEADDVFLVAPVQTQKTGQESEMKVGPLLRACVKLHRSRRQALKATCSCYAYLSAHVHLVSFLFCSDTMTAEGAGIVSGTVLSRRHMLECLPVGLVQGRGSACHAVPCRVQVSTGAFLVHFLRATSV